MGCMPDETHTLLAYARGLSVTVHAHLTPQSCTHQPTHPARLCVQVFLERQHHLHVPGFASEVRPYRRPTLSAVHRARTVAVRQAMRQDAQAESRGRMTDAS